MIIQGIKGIPISIPIIINNCWLSAMLPLRSMEGSIAAPHSFVRLLTLTTPTLARTLRVASAFRVSFSSLSWAANSAACCRRIVFLYWRRGAPLDFVVLVVAVSELSAVLSLFLFTLSRGLSVVDCCATWSTLAVSFVFCRPLSKTFCPEGLLAASSAVFSSSEPCC